MLGPSLRVSDPPMPKPDHDKLNASLAGLLSGAPSAGSEQGTGRKPEPARPAETAHARTSTGYVRESGEKVYRVSLMLTKAERRRLREMAEEAETNISALVRDALGLGGAR